ncbi:MAG: acyl carrier protein [Roseburia sp.]|nr:acyl carrier protein [Muribaculum sp.]MCM1440118.1 acyl carrier protein [Roseburia sp.]
MDEKIIEIMKSVFNTDAVSTNTNQCNCDKWDSLHHLNLIVELEDAFDMEFEPEEIAEMKSFEAVKKIIESKQA